MNVERLKFSSTQSPVLGCFASTEPLLKLPEQNLFCSTNPPTLFLYKIRPGKLLKCAYILPIMDSFTQG